MAVPSNNALFKGIGGDLGSAQDFLTLALEILQFTSNLDQSHLTF